MKRQCSTTESDLNYSIMTL